MTGTPAAQRAAGAARRLDALYAVGAVMLVVEAAVHVQQFVSLFHAVRWIGPLFLANSAACIGTVAGLAQKRSRPLAALAGIGISAGALGSLVLSYGPGLFGWMEGGWRTALSVALVSELGAVLALGAGLAATALRL